MSIKCLLFAFLFSTAMASADDGEAFFSSRVLPLLQSRCYECHSHEKKIKGGLALDSRVGWERGGDQGPVVTPGNLADSLLIQAVRYVDADLEMPPRGKLSSSEIEILERWVTMGAPDTRVTPENAASAKGINLDEGRKHWAYQALTLSVPPAVRRKDWANDPVDRFLLASLENVGLSPADETNRYAWLRRVFLDVTGLPPASEAIVAFVNDASPNAKERVVDRLFASPGYGERWARHWLDLTGYADQIGTSNNVFAEHAWRYRDYVIQAFNQDKPWDLFIREQIAGDLLPSSGAEDRTAKLTATGFLVLGDVEIVNVDKLRMEVDLVDQQTNKVGTAFLGMTIGCARCHDHKFDAISQRDYYAIAGVFKNTDCTYKTDRGVWSHVNSRELPETVDQRAERAEREQVHAEHLTSMRVERASTEMTKNALSDQLGSLEGEARAALEKQRNELSGRIGQLDREIIHADFFAPSAPRAFAVSDRTQPEDMRITIRGNPYALGDSVPRGVLAVASWGDPPSIPADESGRRQLADWIADPRNPLTPRVTVNRLWQKLFGEGLVRSVDYFDVRGDRPTHPQLLDHLAVRFIEGSWSPKRLLRSLVLTSAYGMGSDHNPLAVESDPDNRLLWRMNRQRLDAEAIRDAMLCGSGTLVAASGGPALPLEILGNVGGLDPKDVNPPSFSLGAFRPVQEFERTVYLPVVRSSGQLGPAKLRDVFDFTQPAQMAGRRSETAVPTQALFLINSEVLRHRAAELAMKLTELSDAGSRLQALWLSVLNRPPSVEERIEAESFLARLRPLLKDDPENGAWTELGHALFASTEFLMKL